MKASSHSSAQRQRQGVALVIILCFIVLLTGLVVAYFSRSMTDRQLSNSSYNGGNADTFAQSAADIIIGDLKQEIVAGSSPTPAGNIPLYVPTAAANMLPARSGNPALVAGVDPIPNLVRRSVKSDTMASPGIKSRAVDLSSSPVDATTVAKKGQISFARWNKHYLIPQLTPGTPTDTTPAAAFVPPDWVFVTSTEGPKTITTTDFPKVVGRYAYAVYDEGGLLDLNVAGYPSISSTTQAASKSSLAYADLAQIGLTTTSSGFVNDLVGWRNYASLKMGGAFSGFTAATFPATAGADYFNLVLSNNSGFLKVNTAVWKERTDQLITSRQELLALRRVLSPSGSSSPLQYLTHFSRDINQPSYISPVQLPSSTAPVVLAANLGGNNTVGGDKLINPSFPAVRATTTFQRYDSSKSTGFGDNAVVGEPFVKKRFSLQRLAWITYKGPSASRTQSDADIQAIINNGIPWTYLQQGTATNIQNYFGLTWDLTNSRWTYDIHRGTAASNRIIKFVGRPASVSAADSTKYVQDSGREPNFFELLKAGISVGSLGKAATTSGTDVSSVPNGYNVNGSQIPLNLRYAFDSSVDYHVIQIGANILSEINPTSYPIRIAFDDASGRSFDGKTGWEFQGVTDLPYLNYVFNGVIRTLAPAPAHPLGGNQAVDGSPHQAPTAQLVTLTEPGNAYIVQVPGVWNPYDPNGTPGVLRPAKFRVVIDSNDPLSPPGSGDLQICRFAAGSKSTTASAVSSDGLGPPNAKYSTDSDVAVGKSADILNGGPGTAIYDAVTFNDSNGTLYREPTLIFDTTAPGNATRVSALSGANPAANIKSIDDNPLAGSSIPKGTDLAPLVLGPMPLAFSFPAPAPTTTVYSSTGYIALAQGTGDNRVYFTYRLQYEYPAGSGTWITYDMKYGRTSCGLTSFQNNWNQNAGPGFSSCVVKGADGWNAYSWASAIDPRTARFGLIMDTFNGAKSGAAFGKAPADTGWIFESTGATTTVGITYPIRQDNSVGFGFANLDLANQPLGGRPGNNQTLLGLPFGTKDIPYPSFSAGWTVPAILDNNGGRVMDIYMFAPGMYAQNNPSAPFYKTISGEADVQPCYYADADGVVRRATGAYVPSSSGNSATTPVGLPTSSINGYSGSPSVYPASKTPFTQSQSRPLLLHRPFRTVAELSYVFRDVPWKNLDFFTPESGDAALLDLFCINETSDSNGLIAGKVNLNTRQAPVLAAIVAGAYVDDPKVTDATVGSVAPTLSTAIGTALTARTADTINYGPLQNVSELIGKWKSAVPASGTTYGIASYQPSNSANKWGIDLPFNSGIDGYKDGQQSYIGFSGATATPSGGTLGDAYVSISNASLKTSMSQVQRFREAPIRALASVGQTRVWNLMIDVVAQTGRYPQSATALDKFVVEGEQRYWVHVAIDRLTGQVIDKQIEVVKE